MTNFPKPDPSRTAPYRPAAPVADETSSPSSPLTRRTLLGVGAGVAALAALGRGAASAATKKKAVKKKTPATTRKPVGGTAATTAAPATKAAASAGGGAEFDTKLELEVAYTYTASGGGFGGVRNPYTAVWLEDEGGVAVRTIDLSIQLGRGLRYIDNLNRWYGDDAVRIQKGGPDVMETISSATRVPGTYSAVWDGKDEKGGLVKQGTYFLCVEAAREHGPYSVVREPVTIETAPFDKKLGSNGELSNITAKLRVKA